MSFILSIDSFEYAQYASLRPFLPFHDTTAPLPFIHRHPFPAINKRMALQETAVVEQDEKKRPSNDDAVDNDNKRAKTDEEQQQGEHEMQSEECASKKRWRGMLGFLLLLHSFWLASHAPRRTLLFPISIVSAHQLAEDYVNVVHNIMYDSQQNHKQPHQVMAWSRPATILEQWNPREIALFEAAMYLHGKQFHKVQRLVKTKSTKDIVAFYYIWKKTSHYTQWKLQYTSDESDSEHEKES